MRGRLLVVAMRYEAQWSDIYWRKQLHYVARFIVRHSDDIVLLVACAKDKEGNAQARAENAAILDRAARILVERYGMRPDHVRTHEIMLHRGTTAGAALCTLCTAEEADLLIIGTRPGPPKGFLGTRRTGHTKEYCKGHLKSGTRLVSVHPPECWIWDHKAPA